MQRVLRAIDNMNDWAGKTVAWLLIPMVFITVFEVVMRYVFNMPTLWAWDVNRQLQGAVVVLGIGYALLHDNHVRVDVIITRISPRKRLWVEAIIYPVLIAFLGILIYRLIPYTWMSVRVFANYTSAWGPPIWPLKILMTLGFIALFLQALVNWTRNLISLRSPGGTGS
jgi:TRAP-type mannitol/chloroaromatic compound transport system permease small subunit